MIKPRIFIGSSVEGLDIAKAFQVNLDYFGEITVWTDGVFTLSRHAYFSLEKKLSSSDFGIFILTGDDIVESRDKLSYSPRDNIILELGLFCGRLGIEHTFIIHPRIDNLKLPSDLLGIETADYKVHTNHDLCASLGAVTTRITNAISITCEDGIRVRWDEFTEIIISLIRKIRKSPSSGGFSFDIIVGISRGGVSVADLISRNFGGKIAIVPLWANRHVDHPKSTFEYKSNDVNQNIVNILKSDRVNNILLLDDVCRSGDTLQKASDFLNQKLPNKTIKTAVVICNIESIIQPDYVGDMRSTEGCLTPFSLLD